MNDVQTIVRSPTDRCAKSEPGQIVLVLQGGGALGSYQAGVYQALHEAGIEPDWIIGTSIGAINASLIAGNSPQNRLSRLREFWKKMEQNPVWSFRDIFPGFNEKLSYWSTVTNGIPGFFRPNPLAHAGDSYPLGADQAGYYSTAPLEQTLTELVDFDLVNRMQAAADRRRRACPHQPDALFRQPRLRTRRQAHHGVGRVAAGISGRSHRRRTLLGRRHFVEHADGGRVRRQPAQELADLRRASVESVRRRADHDGGSAEPAQGRAVFQPDRQPHRAPAAGASAAPCHQPARRATAGVRAQQRSGEGVGELRLPDADACGAAAGAATRPARTTPRTSTSVRPASCSAGTPAIAHTKAVLERSPGKASSIRSSGVVLHEQMEMMPRRRSDNS